MKQLPSFIGWTLLVISLGMYCYGIYYAIFIPDAVTDSSGKIAGLTIPEPLDTLVAAISAILLTNLGAVLGISVTNPSSALAAKTLISKNMAEIPPPLSRRDIIQLTCVIIYIVVLLACFIKWAANTFQKPAEVKLVVPFVQQYGKTLIGVITAYLAFVLGTKKV